MPRTTRPSESTEGICPVCSETINIYAIGMCDHPVCYSCSTRMRVLSEQMQCAICRLEIPKVIFTQHSTSYEKTDTYNFQVFRKFKVFFENDSIQEAFYKLLDHACQLCEESKKFRTFAMLRDHMRKEHSQYYCELCVNHLRVFSHQRRFYDRTKLALHRRVGDEDDKSHRGHPLCEFCDERFLDNDELVRHLRKEHYYCHFCDADGITNQFYSEYSFLRDHFKDSHYLCEDGECMYVEFTNAFRGEIDLKAHITSDHANKMRKSHARQARTLDIDFNLTPRPGYRTGVHRDRRNRDGERENDRDRDREPEGHHTRRGGNNVGPVVTGDDFEEVQQQQDGHKGGRGRGRGGRNYGRDQRYTDSREVEDTARAITASLSENMPVLQNKDFPSLDGNIVNEPEQDRDIIKRDPAQSNPDNMANHFARSNNFSVNEGGMAQEDFPSLGGKTKSNTAGSDGNAAWAFKPTNKDFPALGNAKKAVPLQTARSSAPTNASWQAPKPAPTRTLPPGPTKKQTPHPVTSAPPKSLSSIGSALLGTSKQNKKPNNKPSSNTSQSIRAMPVPETEEFPVLGEARPGQQPVSSFVNTNSHSKKESKQHKTNQRVKTVEAMFDEEFPSLGKGKKRSENPPVPAPTPAPAKEVSVQSIAAKKLQNQQKHTNNDALELSDSELSKMEQVNEEKPQSRLHKKEDKVVVKAKPSPKINRKDFVSENQKSNQESPKLERVQDPLSSKSSEQILSTDNINMSFEKSLSEDKWETAQTEKSNETKKRKKVEKFEDEYPSLGSGTSAAGNISTLDWGKKDKVKEAHVTHVTNKETLQVLKAKKKNKKEKDNANKYKADKEPAPTWGYDPDFVAPVVIKAKPKEPPGLIYKENKEPRDKDEPWGPILGKVDDADFPSLFKSDEALKDQSNFSLATLTSHMKGFSMEPEPVIVKDTIPELVNDFPKLESVAKPSPPPGLGFTSISNPPPGFSSLTGPTDNVKKPLVNVPPPGFPVTQPVASPLSQLQNDLPQPEYQKPACFMDRNTCLIATIQAFLGGNEDLFQQFKKSSGYFRQGKISGSDYYEACMNIIGPDSFREVFSELLALLPDIDKQHELLNAHTASKQLKKGMTTKKEKAQRKAWATADNAFTTCPTCRQILIATDVSSHGTEHNMNMDFPMLESTPANKYGFRAWVKGK